VNLPDDELLRRLVARDGPLASLSWRHTDAAGNCRYTALYPDGDCPWCAAEAKRQEWEARPAAAVKEG